MKPLVGTDLKRFIRRYRRENPPQHKIALLLQSVAYPANVGTVFRMADGAGVAEVILSGITPTPPQPTIDRVSRNKHTVVPWRTIEDPVAAVHTVREAGYLPIALEMTAEALPYHEVAYPPNVCLVAGHEDHGVTQAVLAACEGAVFVPMYGRGRSLNVAVALSIVTYHIRTMG